MVAYGVGRMLAAQVALLGLAGCHKGAPPPPADMAAAAADLGGMVQGAVGSGRGTFQAEPVVAAAGSWVVVSYMDQLTAPVTGAGNPARIKVAVSNDGGKSFAAPFAVTATGADQFDPTLAIDADGRTYLGWFDADPSGGRHIRVATAATPTGPYAVAPPLDDPVRSEVDDRPWIALASDGTVYVEWIDRGAGAGVYLDRSDDRGATFHRVLTQPNQGVLLGCLAVAPDGTLYSAGSRMGPGDVVAARSTDRGATFGFKVVASLASTLGKVVMPTCAATPQNGLVVSWREIRNAQSFDADIKIALSPDGQTFAAPITLPAPAGTITTGSPRPTVAVDAGGSIHVQFYARSAAGANVLDQWAAWVGVAGANGAFGQSIQLSPGLSHGDGGEAVGDWPTWMGDFAGIVSAKGKIHVAYADNRSGDADVYYTALP